MLDQIVALERAGSPAISPDGRRVAYTVRDTDFVENAFVTQVWLADALTGSRRPLTRGRKSSDAPAWSPDGRMIAFASERGEKRQVWLLDLSGGDALPLTSAEDGILRFAWSPDGRRIAYAAIEPKPQALKEREQADGDLQLVGEDHRNTQLWIVELDPKQSRRLTHGAFSVGAFRWSPDGQRIAFDHQVNADLSADSTSDLSIVTVADGTVRPLVSQKGPDVNPMWSPDGSTIAFETTMADPWYYYANTMIATVPAVGGPITPLTREFDEDCSLVDWKPNGVFFAASWRTGAYLYQAHPDGTDLRSVAGSADLAASAFSLSRDGERVAFIGSGAASYPEIYVAPVAGGKSRPLTQLGDQLHGWALGSSEVIQWKSRDGTAIEGVLIKPPGFKPGKRRPLIVVIHGGPTGVSRPTLFASTYVYPIEPWLARGALVLEPNYRGSAGYGAAFRALNVRNLGVGDAWDVVSGVDALVARGLVDSMHVGVCGWSQGGYISAFLATHESRRFRAISVGAGISDWMTYYVNTDITPFTRQYLRATPWDDPEIYARTSPITTVRSASAPTLIQHGDADARVPTPDAWELYRGLMDVGVPTRLVLYKGFGHGLNKPKAIRAALRHNLEWFDRWLFEPAPGRARAER
jgi:dipeptidyl aminopeptidase/acylaminoacyl peptidase